MKTIVLIALTMALVAMVAAKPHGADVEAFRRIHDECQADTATKVDKESIEKFNKGEEVDEVQFGKHSLCISIKMGVQNEHGDIDKEALKKGFEGSHNDKAQQIIDECGEKKGNTAEEAALALAKCMRKYRPAPPKYDHHGHHH